MNWHHIKLNNIRCRLFGCAAIGVILGAAGCIPGKSYSRDAIEAPVAVYLVEESIDAYVPVRAIKSPALDDFINNPRDLVSVLSNGHAADGYFVQMAIVKANSAQCVIWSFANSGEFVVQDKVVRVSRNGEIAFLPKNENLPFKFFKSPTLSNIARGLQTVRCPPPTACRKVVGVIGLRADPPSGKHLVAIGDYEYRILQLR